MIVPAAHCPRPHGAHPPARPADVGPERAHRLASTPESVGFSLSPAQLIGLLIPGYFGRGPALHWGLWPRVDVGYIGIITLVLALVGIALRRNKSDLDHGRAGCGLAGLQPRHLQHHPRPVHLAAARTRTIARPRPLPLPLRSGRRHPRRSGLAGDDGGLDGTEQGGFRWRLAGAAHGAARGRGRGHPRDLRCPLAHPERRSHPAPARQRHHHRRDGLRAAAGRQSGAGLRPPPGMGAGGTLCRAGHRPAFHRPGLDGRVPGPLGKRPDPELLPHRDSRFPAGRSATSIASTPAPTSTNSGSRTPRWCRDYTTPGAWSIP